MLSNRTSSEHEDVYPSLVSLGSVLNSAAATANLELNSKGKRKKKENVILAYIKNEGRGVGSRRFSATFKLPKKRKHQFASQRRKKATIVVCTTSTSEVG